MTKKSHHAIDRKHLAAELRHLADQLDEGIIQTDEGPVALGEPIFFKARRKAKKERIYLTFSCKMALAGTPAPTAGVPPEPPPASPRPPQEGVPATAKGLKKELARLWREVGGRINADTPPEAADAAKLRRLFEEYRLYTPTAWAGEWQACATTVGHCLDAAAGGDLARARDLIAAINQQAKECHRLHK